MIELKGLWKSFEDRDVLKDINATFENGKRILSSDKVVQENSTDEMYRRTTDAGTW